MGLLGIERDPEGVFRERLRGEDGLRVAQYLKWTGLRFTASEDLDAWFTIANSSPQSIEQVRVVVVEAGGTFGRVKTLDPGIDVAMGRLAFDLDDYGVQAIPDPETPYRSKYGLPEECEEALKSWYGVSPAQTAAVRLKLARQWRKGSSGAPSRSRPSRPSRGGRRR